LNNEQAEFATFINSTHIACDVMNAAAGTISVSMNGQNTTNTLPFHCTGSKQTCCSTVVLYIVLRSAFYRHTKHDGQHRNNPNRFATFHDSNYKRNIIRQ
jgi:hypothetical protein